LRRALAAQRRSARIAQGWVGPEMPSYVLGGLENVCAADSDLKNFRPTTVTSFDGFMDVEI
jgi:hypothetical protein